MSADSVLVVAEGLQGGAGVEELQWPTGPDEDQELFLCSNWSPDGGAAEHGLCNNSKDALQHIDIQPFGNLLRDNVSKLQFRIVLARYPDKIKESAYCLKLCCLLIYCWNPWQKGRRLQLK